MKYDLSKSEQKIMNILWAGHRWMTINEIIKILEPAGIFWKRQTVNTFLARLINKGLVIQNSRKYIYAYTEEGYQTLRAKELLNVDYGGSLVNFITALSGNRGVTKDEAEQLKNYLEQFKEEKKLPSENE